MIKLPRLPFGWKTVPQLFERYWDETLKKIEEALNAILQIPIIAAGLVDATAEIATKEDIGVASAEITAHEAAANPHPVYLTQTEADALYVATGGGLTDGDKGDVTVSGAGAVWAIDNNVVTFAKMQDASVASVIVGRGAGSGAGDLQEVTLGTNLSMTGTVLNAASSGISDGDKGDITVSISGTVWAIDNNVVTFAKMQDASSASILVGRGAGSGAGDLQELTLGTNLSLSGTTLNAAAGGGITDGDKGDITVSGGGSVWSIDAGAVTLAKQADVATSTVFYRKTASTGSPEVQTLATLKTDLGLTGTNTGDQSSIVGITGTLSEFNTSLVGADFVTGGGTATGTNTGDQTSISGNAGTATVLEAGRTLAISGDLVWTSPVFNGSTNVTAAGTLATVNSNVGSFGSSTLVPVVTVNAKGLVTAVSTVAVSGGGGLSFTTVEVNLGSTSTTSGLFTIAVAGMTVGKPVLITQAIGPYTGKGLLGDDATMDRVDVVGSVTTSTTITCHWVSTTGPILGNFKFNYAIGG